jgi:Cys-tRNA(Pro)/Cys-tRNA(Cys) deacylase
MPADPRRAAAPVEKTNAMRALDQRRVPYETYTYPPDLHSAVDVAQHLGLPPDHVYKTLVVLRDRGRPLLVMVPGDRELDERLFAQAIGEKHVAMAPKVEAERLTGLQVGGIGALALIGRKFDVYIDARAQAHDTILVNGGRRGLNLRVPVRDLVALTGARSAPATG